MWPYKILIKKLQELEEKPNFSLTLVFEYFCNFDFKCTLIFGHGYIILWVYYLEYKYKLYSQINSETGSFPSSDLRVPVIPSFSISGKNKCTNSGVYGGAITSNTYR